METKSNVERRTFLDLLASLVATGSLAAVFQGELRRGGPNKQPRSTDGVSLAVSVMRFVNTAELWHKLEAGAYVEWPDILGSPVIARMARETFTERMGIGRSLLARISAKGGEVIPSWTLQLRLTDGPSTAVGYVAVLSRAQVGPSTFALASDQSGVIYAGTIGHMEAISRGSHPAISELPWVEHATLGELRRLGKRGSLRGIIKRAALFSCDYYSCDDCEYNDSYCVCDNTYPCCVYCETGGNLKCETTGKGPNCCDCGCAVNCAWVCCAPV